MKHLQKRKGKGRVAKSVLRSNWPILPLITSSSARDVGRSVTELSTWMEAAGITRGRVFRRVSSAGKSWGDGVTEEACLARCDGIRDKSRSGEPRTPQPASHVRSFNVDGYRTIHPRSELGHQTIAGYIAIRAHRRPAPLALTYLPKQSGPSGFTPGCPIYPTGEFDGWTSSVSFAESAI